MYANPYYAPYYENEDELEHYGVKGMKWGVRKEEEKASTAARSKPTSVDRYVQTEASKYKPKRSVNRSNSGREMITYTMDNDVLADGWNDYMVKATEYGGDQAAYDKAAAEFNELERALLVAWQAVRSAGLEDRVSVILAGDSEATMPEIMLKDRKTGAFYSSIDACLAVIDAEKEEKIRTRPRSRERNVDLTKPAVSVSKGETINDKTNINLSLTDRMNRKDAMKGAKSSISSALSKQIKMTKIYEEKKTLMEDGRKTVRKVLGSSKSNRR